MREVRDGRNVTRLVAAALLTISAMTAGSPVAANVGGVSAAGQAAASASGLPTCAKVDGPARPAPHAALPVWRTSLDPEGSISGHSVRFGGSGGTTISLGRRAFGEAPTPGLFVFGSRRKTGTSLHVVNVDRECELGAPRVQGWIFGLTVDQARSFIYYSSVAVGSRRELGVWRVALDGARPEELVMAPRFGPLQGSVRRSVTLAFEPDGRLATSWCSVARCSYARFDPQAADVRGHCGTAWCNGALLPAVNAALPLVAPRPVPVLGDPKWAQNTVLRYRWDAAQPPPGSIRRALNAVADDASTTRRSQAPTFRYDRTATDGFRYTESFPSWSSPDAIANAARSVPDSWVVYIRPQGYQFRWGPMRWCQMDPGTGCFDVERIALHELGHVVGLDHPERAGFRLRPRDTVMHSTSPARPNPGSLMHAFGPCDTATLQERYDVASSTSRYSTCNSVDTTLVLSASALSLNKDDPVTFVATLRVTDRDRYGRLGGNALSGRSVQLLRRPAGTVDTWQTFTMAAGPRAGTYTLTLAPSASYDYRALFHGPSDEGLNGTSSQAVTVHLSHACGTPPCPAQVTRP
jgi:hypothetical protein